MTKQEIFDKVSWHLMLQSRESVDSFNNCCYRGENGTECAVGCLIPDRLYLEDFERLDGSLEPVVSCGTSSPLTSKFNSMLVEIGVSDEIPFLAQLQRTHDTTPVKHWELDLYELALDHSLNTNKLDDFKVIADLWSGV